MPNYLYRLDRTFDAAKLVAQLPMGVTCTVNELHPPAFARVTLSSSSALEDLNIAMAAEGYTYVEEDPQGALPVAVYQPVSHRQAADQGPFSPSAWNTVATVMLATKGGTAAGIFSTVVGAVAGLGSLGNARTIVNGGAWTDDVIGGAELPTGSATSACYQSPIAIPATANYTSYVFALQVNVTGIGSTIALPCATNKAAGLAVLAVTEYK